MNKTENKRNESQDFEIDFVALLKEIVKKLGSSLEPVGKNLQYSRKI